MDLQLFKTLSRYPFIYEGNFYDTVELQQNKTCAKCDKMDCISSLTEKPNLTEYICSKDYDNIILQIGKLSFILNGLIYKTNKSVPLGRKQVRQEYIVERDSVLLFCNKIFEIEKHLVTRENETTEKNFSIFHDFRTSMNIFFNCTQDIINSFPGETFEEKLKGSNKSYQDLYHSLRLITSQLGMVDVILNPERIVFGNKREINIYKLFDKVSMLFEHLTEKKKEITISLVKVNDSYIRNSNCYESIEFIPLILLENALKYSAPYSEVIVQIEQRYNKVKIAVKSIGPFVAEENREKIFEKFFRDEAAKEYAKEGIGMGLWIAQQILKAHNATLQYHKDSHATGKIGLNIFEFELPTV